MFVIQLLLGLHDIRRTFGEQRGGLSHPSAEAACVHDEIDQLVQQAKSEGSLVTSGSRIEVDREKAAEKRLQLLAFALDPG